MLYGTDIIFYDIGITFYNEDWMKPEYLVWFPKGLEFYYYWIVGPVNNKLLFVGKLLIELFEGFPISLGK